MDAVLDCRTTAKAQPHSRMGTLISNNEQETCTEYFKRVCIFAENKTTRHTEADQGIEDCLRQILMLEVVFYQLFACFSFR